MLLLASAGEHDQTLQAQRMPSSFYLPRQAWKTFQSQEAEVARGSQGFGCGKAKARRSSCDLGCSWAAKMGASCHVALALARSAAAWSRLPRGRQWEGPSQKPARLSNQLKKPAGHLLASLAECAPVLLLKFQA